MKWILVLLISFWMICLLTLDSFGDPFLVCDPPPSDQQVTAYNIYQDGTQYAANVPAQSDGSLLLDLQDLAPGQYEWTAEAINAWGLSALSDPYISPSAVTAPSGLRMEP